MEKAVALFTNPEFSIKELTNSLYLDILMIKQCFQASFILLNNKYNNESDYTSRICPTNLFTLKDNQCINISSLLTSNSSDSRTSWTYSPFNIDSDIDWLPNFFIHQSPLLINIPMYSMNSINRTIRWLIYLRLSIEIDEKNSSKHLEDPLIVSLYPNIIMNSLNNTSSCWLSPKIIINLQNNSLDQRIDLNLFTYTSDDLLFNYYDPNDDPDDDDDGDDDVIIHLNVHVMNSSNSCLLHLYNPLIFSFHNFIHNYYNLENYFSLMLLKSIYYFPLYCIYPFYKQYTIHNNNNKFDLHLIVAKQQLMINNLEVKLNKFCTWNVYKFNKHLLYLITNGIFNGICLYVNMNWSISNPIIIEIRSSSRKLLNLLDQILFTRNNVDEFHFVPYTQSLLDSDISNKTINVQKSIIDSFNYLIDETEYLINQITQLIECTMYKRIPELSVFLKDLTNNLDIAHRTAEWRSIVNKASTMPIDHIPSSLEYCQLRLQTDIHLKNLCFINNF